MRRAVGNVMIVVVGDEASPKLQSIPDHPLPPRQNSA